MGMYGSLLSDDLVKQIQTQKKPEPFATGSGLMSKGILPKGSPVGIAPQGAMSTPPPQVIGGGLNKIPQGLNPVGTGGPTTNFASINDLAALLGIGGRGTSFGVNAMNNIGQDGRGW